MGQQSSAINEKHRSFIEAQKIFFVASAAPRGRVNVSPKGMATLRVLATNEVAYLDCTGSGSETRAHLLASDDQRLTIMFCAFEGPPLILRLYGQGQSLMRGTPEYGATSRKSLVPARSFASPSTSCRRRAVWGGPTVRTQSASSEPCTALGPARGG